MKFMSNMHLVLEASSSTLTTPLNNRPVGQRTDRVSTEGESIWLDITKKDFTVKAFENANVTSFLTANLYIYSIGGLLALAFSLVTLLSRAYSTSYILLIISLAFWGMVITVLGEKKRRKTA